MDSPFEVGWPRHAERVVDSKDRSARAQWVFPLLGGLTLQVVLANPKAPDFQFGRR
jgi:hypothetical protein